MKKFFQGILLVLAVLIFFYPVFSGKLPIPSDDIVGLYNPFRDLYAKSYPNGIPFKNFLLTDPVRQQYPWKFLSVNIEKSLSLPLWNPYNGAGTPLLANFQSGAFYPFNIFSFILPFNWFWTGFVAIQPFLIGLFMYLYLRNLKLEREACLLGSIAFAFCGFSISWLEWGNVIHTALWLPLILFAIDKFVKDQKPKWYALFILAQIMQILAGHLQILFYSLVFSNLYFLFRLPETNKKKMRIFTKFFISEIVVFFITSAQWIPTLQFIVQSARDVDQALWQQEGWFVPWQHLVQFIVPDFFGNPSTLNYWGTWNYIELVGYIGVTPIIFSFFGLFSKQREKWFYVFMIVVALFFALPTVIAKIPFILNIPFISTSQPTRLLFVVEFSLCVLASLGVDNYSKDKKKNFIPVLSIFFILFLGLWSFLFWGKKITTAENVLIVKNNLYVPTLLFVVTSILLIFLKYLKRYKQIILYLFIVITFLDLFRFGHKLLPFAGKQYLYPATAATQFLQLNATNYRVMTTDSRIFPPNFSIMYKLQALDLYDPLYLRRYAELIAASERGKPDIAPPFGYNRIITPHNVNSRIIDLLGVKYILSFDDLKIKHFHKVFQEGTTKVYENKNVFPRAFFVGSTISSNSKQQSMSLLFAKDLKTTAIVENYSSRKFSLGAANIIEYSPNKVAIKTDNSGEGFLVLTDTYYNTWKAYIDGQEVPIILTDFDLRGLVVPQGQHVVQFGDFIL